MIPTLDYSESRWTRLRADYAAWWDGKLERPLVPVHVNGLPVARPRPPGPHGWLVAQFETGTSAGRILDAWEHTFAETGLMGDAYPRQLLNYGPGMLAVAFGARPEVLPSTVWFHPPRDAELGALDFTAPDFSHPWIEQMRELIDEAARRWGNRVQLDMTDLGSPMDVLHTFRPSEALMLDLYDAPEQVERASGELDEAWWALWRRIDAWLRAAGMRGYGSWGGLFSEKSHYMFQCDVCYMIGPDQFRRFVLPSLRRSFAQVEHAFYHLDGAGQIAHLDMLLEEPDLRGIQWVPGAGQKRLIEWEDLIRRVLDAGKLLQLVPASDVEHPLDQFEALLDRLGTGRNMQLYWAACRPEEAERFARRLERIGVPVE
jgi:hypothetical protein